MPNASLTVDPFPALAAPRRREIVQLLAKRGKLSVSELIEATGLPQADVSKHLAALREAELVSVERDGRRRIYSLQPESLLPIRDWIAQFEEFWSSQLDRIQARAEQKVRERAARN